MKNNINVKLKGKLIIRLDNKVLLVDHNEVNIDDALMILSHSIAKLNYNAGIDIIKATGVLLDVVHDTKTITSVVNLQDEPTITFRTIFNPGDFNGTITKLELGSSLLSKFFSKKEGISIFKPATSQLEVIWTITINN